MSSRIEQLIDEIEQYIDSCKPQMFSSTKIIVDKEEMDNLLHELRTKTPDEIKRYQKIISNRETILNDAKEKAQALIKEATVQTNQLINEHEIMQQAYAQANEVVSMATKQAQEILNSATIEANEMRASAVDYTDQLLAHVQEIINQTTRTAQTDYDALIGELDQYAQLISSNRAELLPPELDQTGSIPQDTAAMDTTDMGPEIQTLKLDDDDDEPGSIDLI
ncbi:MAG: vacuolar family H+-ATPase subunit H [Lachnospiraceae bacterium]|nr:vacuolar family H+-ATPase subunit H [Lachnospiraceae bacterium]